VRAEALAVHPNLEVRPLDRPDASAISSAKAARLFGWVPSRSWRDTSTRTAALLGALPG
jgi:UDP-glucose 4-epimerase